MIDTEDIINVRAIEKDENGVTHIFNNAYDNKFNSSLDRDFKSFGSFILFKIFNFF